MVRSVTTATASKASSSEVNEVAFNQELLALETHVADSSILDALLGKYDLTRTHLEKLEAAGVVFKLNADTYHLHAPALIAEADAIAAAASPAAAASEQWSPCASEEIALKTIEAQIEEAEPAYRAVVVKASGRRKAFWGGAVAVAGLQAAVVSRLTFFDLDWDIMEPVSYFLGSGTSLCFFIFMLKFGADCTPRFFDETVTGKFAKDDAVVKYLELVSQRDALKTRIDQKRQWFETRRCVTL
jgi:hypothetical protein